MIKIKFLPHREFKITDSVYPKALLDAHMYERTTGFYGAEDKIVEDKISEVLADFAVTRKTRWLRRLWWYGLRIHRVPMHYAIRFYEKVIKNDRA